MASRHVILAMGAALMLARGWGNPLAVSVSIDETPTRPLVEVSEKVDKAMVLQEKALRAKRIATDKAILNRLGGTGEVAVLCIPDPRTGMKALVLRPGARKGGSSRLPGAFFERHGFSVYRWYDAVRDRCFDGDLFDLSEGERVVLHPIGFVETANEPTSPGRR